MWKKSRPGRVRQFVRRSFELLSRVSRDVDRHHAEIAQVNDELAAAYGTVCELEEQAHRASLSDKSHWANQNVVFARALDDMFPLAKTILKGALARDECRGAHYKPEFAMPEVDAAEPAEARRQAEAWCLRFEENNRKWLKSTVATLSADGHSVRLSMPSGFGRRA